jgi:hypothetical protein
MPASLQAELLQQLDLLFQRLFKLILKGINAARLGQLLELRVLSIGFRVQE